MKRSNMVFLFAAVALAITFGAIAYTESYQVKPWLRLDKEYECINSTYEQPIYGNVTRQRDIWVRCTAFSEENQSYYTYPCQNGTENYTSQEVIGYNNITDEKCADRSLTFDTNLGVKELIYKQFGKCEYQEIPEGIRVICDSKHDGNGDGKCQSGESCCTYIVTSDGIQSSCDLDTAFVQTKQPMEVSK